MLMFLCPSVPVSFDIALVSLCDIAKLQPDSGLIFYSFSNRRELGGCGEEEAAA
jgi:hypothetical protein